MHEEYRIGEITMSDRTEYIDKQATIGAIHSAIYSYFCGAEDGDELSEDEKLVLSVNKAICTAIKAFPSADVQPVRQTAEWIYGEKDGADGWYCSKCGFHVPWYYEYYGLNNINFIKDFHTCPHCDAKMLKYTGMEREQNG